MEPMKGSEGLKIGLAGMVGCFLAVSLAWRWSGSVIIALLALPVGFITGWIAYAPISFFAALPRAWRRATTWRPPAGFSADLMETSALAFSCLTATTFLGTFIWLTELDPEFNKGNKLGWRWFMLGPCMFVFIFALATAETILCGQTMGREKIEETKLRAKRFWKSNLYFNILTIPFFWIPLWLIKATLMIPAAAVATAKGIVKGVVQTLAFLIRFIRVLAEITASNGRLTSGTAAILGTSVCLWQNWPPIPGCLAGFAAGLGLWGLSVLTLRFLPVPRPATV
ncbi:MAG: hypothetical protein HYT46_01920 [Candidatus Vogelbacteria bacterium]|nr:hypothetical protein [Candidatus Vogelbacteria bacterium]